MNESSLKKTILKKTTKQRNEKLNEVLNFMFV